MTSLIDRVNSRASRIMSTATAEFSLWKRSADYGEGLTCYGRPMVDLGKGSTLTLGSRVVLCSQSKRRALGVSRPVILRTLLPGSRLVIGDDVGLSGVVVCAAYSVEIGSRVLLGAEVMIFDTAFHPLHSDNRRYAPFPPPKASDAVTIADDVFIGARAIVLPGATIGAGTVVGAGSVVSGDIPERVPAAGNPCRVIRDL